MRRLRPLLTALVAGACAAGAPVAHAAAAPAGGAPAAAAGAQAVVPPLSADGSRLVDARGRTVVIQGVNWFGFETSNGVVHGLWSRDHRDMLRQVRRLGFNAIRLPFSLETLKKTSFTGVDFSAGRNAALRGKTPLEAMDVIVDEAARQGLMVLLENHSLQSDGYTYGLWYGQAGYDEDDWIAAWQRLAARYADSRNVIGADLKNEPHGPATWGGGGPSDWRRAATRAGNAVLSRAPHWLVVVEGIEQAVPGGRLDRHWWGGNLEGVRRAPVRLSRPGKLVYSPHEYGPGVFPQPWFGRPDTPRRLAERWRLGFGFIVEQDIAPVLVGEFGGRRVDRESEEGRWQRQFLDYLARKRISWTYWALNPNSGDTGGILRDDWKSVDTAKVGLLQRVMRRQRVAYLQPGQPAAARKDRSQPRRSPAPAPRPAPAPQSQRRPSGRTGAAQAQARIDAWPGGWCGHLVLRGPAGRSLSGARVQLVLPGGAQVGSAWNLELDGSEGALTGRLPEWAALDPSGAYAASGLCGTGSAQGLRVSAN